MIKPTRIIWAILFLIACPAILFSQNAADNFHLLDKLKGTWVMESKKGKLYEDWKQKDETTLTGSGYYLSGKDTVLTEYHDLVLKGNEIFYMANPKNHNNNNQPVPFKLVSSENGVMVFENRAHDFPQRVVYKIPADNKNMMAWIEGNVNGKFKKIEFPYTKFAD